MRILIVIALFLSANVSAQQDTIHIEQLDQTLFIRETKLRSILLFSEFRPINFFYSNVFEYKGKPFTGIAVGKSYLKHQVLIELREGRILHLRDYQPIGSISYKFDRMANDSSLAVDSSFFYDTTLQWRHSSRLFMRGEKMRVCFQSRYNEVSNGYYPRCSGSEWCTDDHWSYVESKDGFQREPMPHGWRQGDYEPLTEHTNWSEYSLDSTLVAMYATDYNERKYGIYLGFWPNGKLRESGWYTDDQKDGSWKYTDSTGMVIMEEWYSNRPDGQYMRHNLDSVKKYFPNGFLRSFRSGREMYDTCYDVSSGEYYELGHTYQQINIEWYDNGNRKSWKAEGFYECNDSILTDTVYKSWYTNGNLQMIVQENNICTQFFADGNVKSLGVPYYGAARHGRVLIVDSIKGVLTDRVYFEGQLKVVHDSAVVRAEAGRADELAGAAIMGLYPKMVVRAGGGCYFPDKVYHPGWKDSLYVPGKVVDSLAIGMYSVWRSFPDTAIALRDSLFAFAKQFHPSKNEWYYTVEFVYADTATAMRNVRLGRIVTGNQQADAFFQSTGCKAVSCKHKGGKFRYGTFEMIIIAPRPLNFTAFFRLLCGSNSYVTMYCGRKPWQLAAVQTTPVMYDLTRSCVTDPGYYCPPRSYYIFTITGYRHRIIFYVNSDNTTDFPGTGEATDYYLTQ